MEVLHYEIISDRTEILIFAIAYSLLSILLGFIIYKCNNKDWKMGLITSAFFVSLMIFGYFKEDKSQYEYAKVKVTDWNVVHNEGWEIIKQEGEIVELKRKLEEEE